MDFDVPWGKAFWIAWKWTIAFAAASVILYGIVMACVFGFLFLLSLALPKPSANSFFVPPGQFGDQQTFVPPTQSDRNDTKRQPSNIVVPRNAQPRR